MKTSSLNTESKKDMIFNEFKKNNSNHEIFFCAPEIILNHENYNEKCDVFAIGCMLYWFVTGEYFFVSEEEFQNQKLKPLEDVVLDNCKEYLKLNEGFKEEMFPENLMKEELVDEKPSKRALKKSNTIDVDGVLMRTSIFDQDMDGDVDEDDKNFDKNQDLKLSENNDTNTNNNSQTSKNTTPWNEIISFLKQTLHPDPGRRPTCKELLQHDLFKKTDGYISNKISKLASPMKSFQKKNLLEKCCLEVIASSANNKQLKELRETFDLIDSQTNGDGMITARELKEVFQNEKLNFTESNINQEKIQNAQAIQELVKQLNTDDMGGIDVNEFMAGCYQVRKDLQHDSLEQAFSRFDVNHNGTISKKELLLGLDNSLQKQLNVETVHDLGDGKTQIKSIEQNGNILDAQFTIQYNLIPDGRAVEVVKKITEDVDKDGDGEISFEEFFTMMVDDE